MEGRDTAIPVLVVAGPTATGKSATAIQLAKMLNGEIICADSMQVYKNLRIGTAVPGLEDLAIVPHHMYNVVNPEERFSVAQYIARASETAAEISGRGKLPILCGGTGQYIDSFCRGLRFEPQAFDPALREALAAEYTARGGQALIEEIAAADPDFARTLHINNKKRIVRALELMRQTGKTIPQQNEASIPAQRLFRSFIAVLNPEDRAVLYQRIEQRVDAMMAAGLLEEARYVYRNRAAFTTAAQAIGYKEFFAYFEQEKGLEDCVAQLKQATRNYAKRQITWFKREESAVWYDSEHPGGIAKKIEKDYKKMMTTREKKS